jgi:DNA-binding NtrC family response regulator
VLAACGQDKEEAARRLEVSLATLYRKLADDGD